MTAVTKFNGWILGKIYRYLELQEGCYVTQREYTDEGARLVMEDAFGFVYEINIRMTGRTNIPRSEMPTRSFIERVD